MRLYLTALLVLLLDQTTKLWVRANLSIGETLYEAGFFRIIRTPPNTGAAFGLFRGYSSILTGISTVTAIFLLACPVFFCRRIPWLNSNFSRFILGLILGGTLGNLADRLQPALGGVTDFISLGIWPTFNLADSAITIGIMLFSFYLFRRLRFDEP